MKADDPMSEPDIPWHIEVLKVNDFLEADDVPETERMPHTIKVFNSLWGKGRDFRE